MARWLPGSRSNATAFLRRETLAESSAESSNLTTEVAADHIRDDAIGPHSLGPGGGGSPPAKELGRRHCSPPPGASVGGGTVDWKRRNPVTFIPAHEDTFTGWVPEAGRLAWTEFCPFCRNTLNMRRSSSSRAMSPQKAACGRGDKHACDLNIHVSVLNSPLPEAEKLRKFETNEDGA